MTIKLVCFDFDGVFTNGDIIYQDNIINKKYNIKDGMALNILKENNIKSCLITGYKKTDYLINNIHINNIAQHLHFDFINLGCNNKLDTLNQIIKNFNYCYSEIAYIGDDINDIEIMEKVGFSACPNDAIQECKKIVNYICKNKGGECCVREFIDKILSLQENKYNKILLNIKTEANHQLNNLEIDKIEDFANLIISKKIIYCTGIGKSENIAIHCSNLLKSIGIKSFYLNCLNSVHGDIGTIEPDDVIIIFSKSGNTNELINIIPSLKNHNPYLVTISCNKDGILNKLSNKSIVLPFTNELEGNINTIPTNSYMSTLFYVNILIMILVDKINIDYASYKLNHPGGNIGTKLMTINDVLIKDFPKIILDKSIKLKNVLLEMTKYSIGCCFFINPNNEFIGLLSDGDIRRLLCINSDIILITQNDINNKFYYETDLNKIINNINNKYKFIPILDNRTIIGIIKC
jgi:arabinose-5-phosphate isomerase